MPLTKYWTPLEHPRNPFSFRAINDNFSSAARAVERFASQYKEAMNDVTASLKQFFATIGKNLNSTDRGVAAKELENLDMNYGNGQDNNLCAHFNHAVEANAKALASQELFYNDLSRMYAQSQQS